MTKYESLTKLQQSDAFDFLMNNIDDDIIMEYLNEQYDVLAADCTNEIKQILDNSDFSIYDSKNNTIPFGLEYDGYHAYVNFRIKEYSGLFINYDGDKSVTLPSIDRKSQIQAVPDHFLIGRSLEVEPEYIVCKYYASNGENGIFTDVLRNITEEDIEVVSNSNELATVKSQIAFEWNAIASQLSDLISDLEDDANIIYKSFNETKEAYARELISDGAVEFIVDEDGFIDDVEFL